LNHRTRPFTLLKINVTCTLRPTVRAGAFLFAGLGADTRVKPKLEPLRMHVVSQRSHSGRKLQRLSLQYTEGRNYYVLEDATIKYAVRWVEAWGMRRE